MKIGGLVIEPLNKLHNKKLFSCKINTLDQYFHKQAGQDSRKRLSATYVLYDKNANKTAGFYTLSANIIELNDLPENIIKKFPSYPYLPATLIGRLAIDQNYQGLGLGKLILVDAVKRAYRASLHVASYAVIVDAINSTAETFYQKYGFLKLSTDKNRFYLPMESVSDL